MNFEPLKLASYFDATNLALNSSEADIQKLCEEALKMDYAAVCIYPSYLELVSNVLKGSDVQIATVAGFPHGRSLTAVKKAEFETAAEKGAHEIDVVMDHGLYASGNHKAVEDELSILAETAKSVNLSLKVIVETCFLSDDDIKSILPVCENAGVDYIKTSTGFGSAGAQVKDVQTWNSLRKNIKIKASGGIRTLEDALAMVEAGADRIGLSAAAAVLKELQDSQNV